MPYPPRTTVLESFRESEKPNRGASRTSLGESRPRPQPASADVTYGIGIKESMSRALELIFPLSSLATTNRPPGTERSTEDNRLLASTMCWLCSYRNPTFTVRLFRGRQSSCTYRCTQLVRPSSSPRPMPDTADTG